MRRAIEKSKNVVAWKIFKEITPKVGLSYPLKMHFANIVDNDYYLSASLGGLTNGVTTVEMASAYATIANDGVYREPTCIKKITDSEGNVILKNNGTKRKGTKVYEKNAARSMTDILTGVLTSGTAAGHELNNMSCAGKTGTTNDKKDGWFCGFTPYYTTTVWVGYDSPRTLEDLYGSTYPLTIWENFMNEIHIGLENKDFVESESSSSKSDKKDGSYSTKPRETIDPEARETETPEETAKPKATKKPVVTATPKAEPEITEPPTTIDDDPSDVPSDNTQPDDVGGDTGDDTE